MKKNFPITGVEVAYNDNANILSTTDLKGAITYANQDFIEISGFSTDELLKKNHNVVRHPDMPSAAFADLWQTIKGGKPWMGIVKNRCKNGDHYWVDAFVMPIHENGSIVEYQSVRSKPERGLIERAEKVYQRINAGKPTGASASSISLKLRLLAAMGLAALPLLGLMFIGVKSIGVAALAYLASLGLGYAAFSWSLRPLDKLIAEARGFIDNPLMRYIYTGRNDEIGQLGLIVRMLKSQLSAVAGRISDTSENLARAADDSIERVRHTKQAVLDQQSELQQVSTAMNEMSATVQEVAKSTSLAADVARKSTEEVASGKQVVDQVQQTTGKLAQEVEQAADVISRLGVASNDIGSVIDVIHGIAEQTNLLALNAAIEAARAGEQGRGFAVVADEVRTLANRTQESTLEIQEMVDQLQALAVEAVKAMEDGRKQAIDSVGQTEEAKQVLNAITEAISTISDMNVQIASAAEEQGAVAEVINRNIVNISTLADETAEGATQTAQSSEEFAGYTSMSLRLANEFRRISR